jgi:hypothetical protein
VKRRVRLPVVQGDHALAYRDKKGRLELRRRKAPRHSPEIQRDSAIEVEPLPYNGPDGPCSDVAEHRAYVARRAARALVGSWQPREGVPATRGDCPPRSEVAASGCPFPKCRHHLWVQTENPGRPGLAFVPRDDRGLTISATGDLGPRSPPRVEPMWLVPGKLPPPSCSLDEADRPLRLDRLGAILGRHRTLAGRLLARALRSWARALAAHGIPRDAILELVEPERHDPAPSVRIKARRGP